MDDQFFDKYRLFMDRVDDLCSKLCTSHAGSMQCRKGCDTCCTGVPVSSVEYAYLAEGITRSGNADLVHSLSSIQTSIQAPINPDVPGEGTPGGPAGFTGLPVYGPANGAGEEFRCAFLSSSTHGHCLVYPWRPLICRVHGLPLLYPIQEWDSSGRRIDTPKNREYQLAYCDLNFEDKKESALYKKGCLSMEVLQDELDRLDAAWRESQL